MRSSAGRSGKWWNVEGADAIFLGCSEDLMCDAGVCVEEVSSGMSTVMTRVAWLRLLLLLAVYSIC